MATHGEEPLRFYLKARWMVCAVVLPAVVLWAGGCSGNGDAGPRQANPFGSQRVGSSAPGSAAARDARPMTEFEKRRLLARVQRDPRQVERLTVRERRELAGMVRAMNLDEEEGR